jgi:hypothetical protein
MSTLPAPLITEAARYVLGLSIAACVAATGVAIAIWAGGRRSGSAEAATRGLVGVLTGLVVLVLVLLLALVYAL